jgi:hypothetical protein
MHTHCSHSHLTSLAQAQKQANPTFALSLLFAEFVEVSKGHGWVRA